MLVHGIGLAREKAFINFQTPGSFDDTVNYELIPCRKHDQVAKDYLTRVNFNFLAVTAHNRL